MARALVVDDSKLARVALKKQLENYNLDVALADSGEDAIDYLKREMVDVVFMDHIMPGMDGLAAVRALKANPRTATIPVMMYTSKEGELYVSQARALGAVDVLPKQVQPGVLFGMLLKLGLVVDRRESSRDEEEAPEAATNGHAAAAELSGPTLPSLLAGVLEDQRTAMRSDLMAAQRSFVQQVAGEVQERQQADVAELKQLLEERESTLAMPAVSGALAVAAAFFAILYLGAINSSSPDRGEDVPEPTAVDLAATGGLDAAQVAGSARASTMLPLVYALAWALNEDGSLPFDATPFDETLGLQVFDLVERLDESGFTGTVRVESHLGEFCLTADINGLYRLADDDAPMSSCTLIGHPLDGSASIDERQSPAFAAIVDDARDQMAPDIEIDVIANDRVNSLPRVSYPVNPTNAGEWNASAIENHRIEYQLLPDIL